GFERRWNWRGGVWGRCPPASMSAGTGLRPAPPPLLTARGHRPHAAVDPGAPQPEDSPPSGAEPVAAGRPLRVGEGGGIRRKADSGGHGAQRPAGRGGPIRPQRNPITDITPELRPPKKRAKEKPRSRSCGVLGKDPGDDLLSHARCTLPSARARFTSEFGMESGGSTQLLSPGRGWRVAVQSTE